MRSFVGWVVGLVFLFIFPKPWDCSSWFNYKIWVCFIPSSSEIFGKPHFRQQWGLVQERSLWSSLKFWTEGFLANEKERNKDASLIAGCPWAGASVGLSAAGLVWIQLCLVRSRWTWEDVKQSTSCAACPGAPGLPSQVLGGLCHCSGQKCGFLQHYRAPYPPDGTWLWRPPGERSRRGQGWRRSACSARRCGTAGRWGSAARPTRSDCHPTARGSERVCLFPGSRHDYTGRSQTLRGGWFLCPLWYQLECFHFFQPVRFYPCRRVWCGAFSAPL